MHPISLLILILLALAAAVMLIALFVFFAVFGRAGKEPVIEAAYTKRIKSTPLSQYLPALEAGKAAIRALPREDVFIDAEKGVRLHAALFHNPVPNGRAVLLAHGYKSFGAHDYCTAVGFYLKHGYDILLIDERAHGKSGGRTITFGMKERYDIAAWCRYLCTQYPAPAKIVLHGISMGASSVMLASGLSDPPQGMIGIVADCGFTCAKSELIHVLRSSFHLPPFPLIPAVNFWCRLLGRFDIGGASTLDAMRRLRVPILLIHGEADHFVPPENTFENYAACPAAKTLVLVPGADHGMSFLTDPDRCFGALSDFLAHL